ncbi:Dirigent protein 17 [Sesamum angolense]|uniref:Dirigent protein n=1 Tax=Sesamum angolense TaxID=2727404 RepID=A0AAE2BXS4_9LAMI|nr:Dirigent protein 17 [Sesamum angolense]
MTAISSLSTGIYASSVVHTTTEQLGSWFQTIGCIGNERTAMIHLYIQDFIGGPNQTVYEVARASITSTSPTSFGLVEVFDDLMTAGPDLNSEKVGRFQGFYAVSDLNTTAYTISINYYFTSGPGRMNGSTISVFGREPIYAQQRELAVIGGTGMFRFASGYNILSTFAFVVQNEYIILNSTIYVTYKDESTPCI